MKLILAICLLFPIAVAAQADSISLKESMAKLDRALISKDEASLTALLSADVSYGHSNGWVQNKADIINDLKSGKLVYDKLENIDEKLVTINNNWASTRTDTNAEGKANGNPFQLKLHILEVWLKTATGWQLIARQSTKLQ